MSISVSFIALTGLGNGVFNSLISNQNIRIHSVCTRKCDWQNPYNPELPEIWELAEKHSIKCICNVDVNSEYYDLIKHEGIDLIIVASYDQIIRSRLLKLPNLGAINVHPSLLPRYRGPSPLQWSILKGEKETGVTIHFIDEGIDTGDIILQNKIDIPDSITISGLRLLTNKLSEYMIVDVINMLVNGIITRRKQESTEATYYKKPVIERRISENDDPEWIWRVLRAYSPYPKAVFNWKGIDYLVEHFSYVKESNIINDKCVTIPFHNGFLNIHLGDRSS